MTIKQKTLQLNLRKIYYLLSPSLRLLIRRIYYLPSDMAGQLFAKNKALMPPKGLIFTGPGDFIAIGLKYRTYFIDLGGLKPEHQVLDVGSGIGRMAIPLTGYLTSGSYEGFDIVKKGVDWCTKNISRRYPDFRFTHISLRNDLYSSTGDTAQKFRFPYPDASFDFVFLTSVFTHMLPAEVEQYMNEITRVLKPHGRCLATFFILNEYSVTGMQQNPDFNFPFNKGYYRLMDDSVQSANVAYDEGYIQKTLASENNLRIVSSHYGYWSGRPKEQSTDYQDIVVFEKTT